MAKRRRTELNVRGRTLCVCGTFTAVMHCLRTSYRDDDSFMLHSSTQLDRNTGGVRGPAALASGFTAPVPVPQRRWAKAID